MKSITQLKLKLTPTDEQREVLASVAVECRKARNVGAENWLLRQRGFPESEKQSRPGRPGKDGKARALGESTKIYHALRPATPSLNSQLHSSLAQQVATFLSSKLDWRDRVADDTMFKRKEAILAYLARPPFFTAVEIPVPNKLLHVTFVETLEFVFPWGSPEQQPLRLNVSTKELSLGHKKILRDIATGERKLADSRIVERNGEYFWHLPVAFETEQANPDVQATLFPVLPDDANLRGNPFELKRPDGRRPWFIGDGWYLLAQTQRLTKLKKAIGWRYRQRMGAGHGRKKIDSAVRKRSQQLANMVAEVRRRAIADVVRQCVRCGVGELVYRKPSLPLREHSWFAKHGLEWDWTRFQSDLINAAARKGIAVVVDELRMKEWMEMKEKAKKEKKAKKVA